ncbi:MAG: alpha/beta hydrolase [Chloroflexi bacterium]|nr:alpha/beta hydrolase [Chloroflexota bacterium]
MSTTRMGRHLGTLAMIGIATGGGLLAAAVTPRGPVTPGHALAWMLGGLALGLVCGAVSGTRWAMLVTPVVATLAFEVGRLGTNGPTVDAVAPGSIYGVIALVTGRGVSALLAWPGLIIGARLGIEGRARHRPVAAPRLGRAAGVGIVACLVVGLAQAWIIVQPASTAPILGPDGQVVAGSVAELGTVRLGGHDQVVLIRGRDVTAPVLLHLAGGPGGTDLGAMRADTSLEDGFVVVTWEQRGAGRSYAALDPAETLTLESMVADTIELTEHLRDRFGHERIFLMGNSWGTLLGVLAVQQRPDLYHAWIGTGQMVSPRATDVMFWEDTIAWAERVGDTGLADTLRRNGPPPYSDVTLYEAALSHEHDWNVYAEFDNGRELPATLFVPENSFMDRLNGLRAFLDTFSVLYPQIQDVDLRQTATRLDVPVYLVAGAHEARGRAVLADAWFAMLDAPHAERVVFEHSGHRPSFEEPAAFATLMERIREEAPNVPR